MSTIVFFCSEKVEPVRLEIKTSANSCVLGKTFVYELIYHAVRALGVRCITMASTGCAATLLPSGRTVHNVWAIPVPTYSDSESRVNAQNPPEELKEAKVFILDEAPMLLKHILHAYDQRLREIHGKPDVPFGGVIMLLGTVYGVLHGY